MKIHSKFNNTYIDLISLIFILLFVYAAISKLLDFDNFKIQLGQSPILSPFAGWVSFFIPLLELIIALLLMFKRSQFVGLLSSFILMFLFSVYIYIMLNYSTFVPCSCGGILEKMTWKQHLLFNIIFVVLAGAAFMITPGNESIKKESLYKGMKFKSALLSLSILLGSGLIILLFSFSENIIHYKNKFIRRFPQHTAEEIYQIDLKYNSYYFAGSADGTIYLGNSTAPLKVFALDTLFKALKKYQIMLDEKTLPFSAPKIRVLNNDFFVFEGDVPYIFKGSTSNWKAGLKLNSGYYFLNAEIIDSAHLVTRYTIPNNGENALGIVDVKDTLNAKFSTGLLERQFDGIIDTDGSLLYNEQLNKIIYLYYYRNEYLVINANLKLAASGNTIDTISKAQVKLIKYKNSGRTTFAKPPLIVNKTSASYGNLLFVNSTLPGLYESEGLWKIASIIDVYDLSDRTYRSSFPVYNLEGQKMKSMIAYGHFLYVLIDQKLICYKLRDHLTQNRAVAKFKK